MPASWPSRTKLSTVRREESGREERGERERGERGERERGEKATLHSAC